MKYFRIFKDTEEYIEYMASPDAILPNVAYCEDGYSYIAGEVTPPTPVDVTGVTINTVSTTIYVGSTYQLVATVLPINATDKAVTWSSSDSTIATVSNNGLVTAVASGATTITVTTHDGGYTASCAVAVEEATFTTLTIVGAPSISAESCNYEAIADNSEDVTTSATWSIVSGSQYATINPNNGSVTILNGASESIVTIQAVYAGLTATTTVTLTYLSGATSETETESTTDIGGNTTTVTTTVTEYEDGSSSEVSETVIVDANGDVIGTSESTKETNADGSYEGTTTNYDAEGNPMDGSNVTGDTDGNVSTQTVAYDDSGNTTVIGYDIDTSETSGKTFNHDGVNTDYYAFDVTHGFELEMNFTIDFANQPSGQDENHHNVLNAKRATPSPYYGFQLRQSGTNNYIQLGTQFSTGSNTNTQINPSSVTGNVGTYNLKILYDPTKSTNKFVCSDGETGTIYYSYNGTFPDIDELKNLKVTIGYAVNSSGNPFRYSNINVLFFSLKKLKNVANPVITCVENNVSITCATANADVYYRVNLFGDYSAYTTPIEITADTIFQAYAEANGDTSDIIREDCKYDNGIKKPVISCDGENVTITCETVGTTIYYRLNESGTYSAYTTPIEITADTIVEAYSELNGETSDTVKETCIYVEGVSEPVISCDGEIILITCDTSDAEIYYRLNESGSYTKYLSSIKITANTIVESYAKLLDRTSDTVRQSCTYNPVHDYSKDYLTFRVISAGTVVWKAVGGGHNRNIQYSLNEGEWTTLTATTAGSSVEVAVNDVIKFKGNNTAYSKDKSNYSGFYEGTALYDVEGNIMSLIYNDNFSGQTSLTANWALSNVFNHSNAVSAKDLVMPATTLKSDCYRATFANSYSLTETPKILPATTLATDCYYYMFDNCRSLTTAPELPATTTASKCYLGMFHSETANSINYIKCLATPSPTNMQNWLQLGSGSNYSVASTGTFVKASGTTWSNGVSGIPTGWTVEDAT